jgi:hypothetical protein
MGILKKILVAIATALLVILGFPGVASATQPGEQEITNDASSASGFLVQYNCDRGGEGLNPGESAGEMGWLVKPYCGNRLSQGQEEPVYVYIGPGWCGSRWVRAFDPNTSHWITYNQQLLVGGSSGHWFQVWQSWLHDDYNTFVRTFYNGTDPITGWGCSHTGPAYTTGAYYES